MGKKAEYRPKIFFAGQINTQSIIEIERTLDKFLSEGKMKVDLHIASPGGGVEEGIAIYDVLRTSGAVFETKIFGQASSMAALLVLVGEKRLISRNSKIFLHPLGTYFDKPVRLTTPELKKYYESSMYSDARYVRIIHERTGGKLSVKKVENLLQQQTILTPEQAKEYGFAHEII